LANAYQLCIKTYKIAKGFLKEERYGLSSHIRRAAVSVPSNKAEGYGRRTTQEYIQALFIAYGSNCELENRILLSGDLKNHQRDRGDIERMFKALIKSLENKHLNP